MNPALLDPERQFLGCVMQLALAAARRLLAGMRSDDFDSPIAAHVLQLAIEVTATDRPPTPVVLMDHARETAAMPRRSGGANRLRALGLWLVDTYSDGPILPPAYYGAWLKSLVLKNAYRRAVREHALRLAQAVEQDAATERLRDLLDDTDRLEDLWRRCQHPDDHGLRLEVAA